MDLDRLRIWRSGTAKHILGLFGVLIVIVVACVPRLAAATEDVNRTVHGIAILGYDPVAYFTEGRPVEGRPELRHSWRDADWLFATAENMQRFAADPERYEPRYGGFCAGGMAMGVKVSIDPEAWAIVDDRLYLFFNRERVGAFVTQAAVEIPKADRHWRALGQRAR